MEQHVKLALKQIADVFLESWEESDFTEEELFASSELFEQLKRDAYAAVDEMDELAGPEGVSYGLNFLKGKGSASVAVRCALRMLRLEDSNGSPS